MYESLGAISRKLGIPRNTLYYNLSDPKDPVYRHKEHWIERFERGWSTALYIWYGVPHSAALFYTGMREDLRGKDE